jgi:hypothetical protein
MSLPIDIRFCVYDQLSVTPVYRPICGTNANTYYTAPSVGILRVNRAVREEAYSIIQRGRLQTCPSITFKFPVDGDEFVLDHHSVLAENVMSLLARCLRFINKEELAFDNLFGQLRSSTLLEFDDWIKWHPVSCQGELKEKSDEMRAVFVEFFSRTSVSMVRGSTLDIRVRLDNNCLQNCGLRIWRHFISAFLELADICPSPSHIMLHFLVPASCVTYAQEIVATQVFAGRQLRRESWRIDVLEDGAHLWE